MSISTQITTGKVRFSYVTVFEPRAMEEGQKPKYSITLIIPKKDKATYQKIQAAIKAAAEKWNASAPKKLPAKPKTTLHDGDGVRPSDGQPYGPECHGSWVMSCSSQRKPTVVDAFKNPITSEEELYSGCYGRAVLNFYGYSNSGNMGISAGLNGVMKLSDGEPLAGGVVTDSDWDEDFEDYEVEGDDDESMLD